MAWERVRDARDVWNDLIGCGKLSEGLMKCGMTSEGVGKALEVVLRV